VDGRRYAPGMKVALGADENTHLVAVIAEHLEQKGHAVRRFGAAAGDAEPWGETGARVAESVARGEHDVGIVCCWTGTGVSIAANKVRGVRAALCADAETARGARKWNDANVLALSLRSTSEPVAREILDAWFSEPYGKTEDPSLEAIVRRESGGG
jgi:ribose 5-phosphate isomerase B